MSGKLLIITRHFWPEKCRINYLCRYLAASGYKVDVLCGQPSTEQGEFYQGYNSYRVRRESRNRVNIFRTLDVKRGSDSHLRIFLNYIVYPLSGILSVRQLAGKKYDAVLVYQTSPVMICAPAVSIGKKQNIPVYIYVADIWPQSFYPVIDVQSGLFRRILNRLSMHYYQKAEKLIVPSDRIRSYFSSRLGVSNDHLPVVPFSASGVFENAFPDEQILEQTAGSFNLLIPGDFQGRLSSDTVVRVADRIRSESIRDIRFLVTGESDKITELRKAVARENLEDYFYFEGQIAPKQFGAYVYVSDIILEIVGPGDIDEYMIPAGLIDLMAAGRPIVISLSGDVKTLIREADCGLTTEPFDADALFESIRRIYRMSADQRKQLGEHARAYQMTHFERQKNAEEILRILNGESSEDTGRSGSEIKNLWDI